MISQRLSEGFVPALVDHWWGIPLLTAVVTGLLAIPVEVAAGAPQTLWWVWPADAITILWEMPALVPFGWAGAAFLFIVFFRRSMALPRSDLDKTVIFVVSTLLVIVLHLVYVLAVRTIIVLLAG